MKDEGERMKVVNWLCRDAPGPGNLSRVAFSLPGKPDSAMPTQ
jgi:hypothetical protein